MEWEGIKQRKWNVKYAIVFHTTVEEERALQILFQDQVHKNMKNLKLMRIIPRTVPKSDPLLTLQFSVTSEPRCVSTTE